MLDNEIYKVISKKNQEIANYIEKETERQDSGIELIASENYPSLAVRAACGSVLTCKYAEGYPQNRYYGGCENVDAIETIAIQNACKLFGAKFANVQPHSGSQANAAAYRALEKWIGIKDRKMKILAMQLNDGGHLTHGSSVSFSSNLYDFCFFPLDKTGHINLKLIEKALKENKPDVILAGCSAYPYKIDFEKIGNLAKKYNAKFIVDMAHIAGLVAAKQHANPVDYADIVTTTTHKTLRGPRGGLILTNNEDLAKKVNSAIFPYYQGGPLEHIIAGKAICFAEALEPAFEKYAKKVIANTKAFTNEMKKLGSICSGCENHLMLLNVKETFGITGLDAQLKLEEIGITANKNMIPNDTESPKTTSGLRIGFAAMTTRGCTRDMAIEIAHVIYDYLSGKLSKEAATTNVKTITSKLKSITRL